MRNSASLGRPKVECDEGTLVCQAQAGDEESFCDLVRSHQGSVRAFLFRYVRHETVMDDLAQETFLSAFRKLPAFRGESSLRVWLLGIARFCALKHLREEQVRLSHQSALLESALAEWKAQEMQESASGLEDPGTELSILRSCIQRLPPSSSNIIKEYYFKGQPLPAVAQSLGKRESAMKMTLLRIREALRECVDRKLASGGAPI